MQTCPHCGEVNGPRAVICRHCNKPLIDAQQMPGRSDTTLRVIPFPEDRVRTLTKASGDSGTTSGTNHRSELINGLRPYEVALIIEHRDSPLIVTIAPSALIGRFVEANPDQPQIDLVPFGAYDKGVSRVHARIVRDSDAFYLEDVGSSNGTWLNGARLEVRTHVRLRSGDFISFGQLGVYIVFRGHLER